MTSTRQHKITYFLRLLLSLSLITFILWKVKWPDLLATVSDINPWYLPPFFLLSFIMIWISCLKWQILLGERNIRVRMGRLFSLYLMGYFFNYFMPGRYGGGLARSYILGREIKTLSESFTSVFLERFTGLTALVAFTLLSSVVNLDLLGNTAIFIPVLLIVLGYLFLLFLLFSNKVHRLSARIRDRFPAAGVLDKLIACHLIVLSFRNKGRIIRNTLIISLLFHAMAILNVVLACLCLGIHIDLFHLALFVPVIQLVCMIPVSINGFGIQEGAYIYLFSLVGVPMHAALSVSLILRAKNIILSLVGGLLFSTGKKRYPHAPLS